MRWAVGAAADFLAGLFFPAPPLEAAGSGSRPSSAVEAVLFLWQGTEGLVQPSTLKSEPPLSLRDHPISRQPDLKFSLMR